jgi:uncharacterized glyoxalase superfamily protein PhnB
MAAHKKEGFAMTKSIPDGYHTVTPYLTVDDLPRLLQFVQDAFGAKINEMFTGPDGRPSHAEGLIGDSYVMMGQARGESFPAMMYVYVENADAVFRKAVAAGARVISEMTDQFYGDRSGGVVDPCGNQWWIATHIEDMPKEEIQRRAAQKK